MMLKMFPGMASMIADFIWFILLCCTSFYRGKLLWKSFVKGKFIEHFITFITIWEWMVIFAGWVCVYGFYQQTKLVKDMNGKLETLRELTWRGSGFEYLERTEALYATAKTVSFQLGYIRFLMAQYLLFLMFRFLVSFAVQPRLATVTNTLKAVMPDLMHFLIVFFPTFLAYVISGNLIFGRRMENFATIQASFATCFRIIMECEYDWDTLAAEYYWTTALWIWSFIVLIVLILLNMVLAIILDIYNDVRKASLSGEMVWTTCWNYWLRFKQMHFWVPDIVLEEHLTLDILTPLVSRADFKLQFPDIPDKQLDLMYEVCAVDMGWEANKYLDKATSLKMSGSVKLTTDSVNNIVTSLAGEDDPLKSFTQVKTATRQQAKKRMAGDGLFLNAHAALKANQNPHVLEPAGLPTYLPGVDDESQEWLKNLSKLMKRQKKWVLYLHWQMQNLQWMIQQSHMCKLGGNAAKNAL
jgi:hypothetical protein